MIRVLAAIALILFGLTTGATASMGVPHAAAHVTAPVAAGEHHHHSSDGGVVDAHDEGPSVPDSHDDGDAVGHSHGTGGFDAAHRDTVPLMAAPDRTAAMRLPGSARALPTLAWSPHKRPPRAD